MSRTVDYFLVALVVVFCFIPVFYENKVVLFIMLELALIMNAVLFFLFLALVGRTKELESRLAKLYKAFSGESVKL